MSETMIFKGCEKGERLYERFDQAARQNEQICKERGISPAVWDEETRHAWERWSRHKHWCAECSGLKSDRKTR